MRTTKGGTAKMVRNAHPTLSDPLARAVTLGVPLVLAVFVFTSPYAEVRFVYPMLMLMVAAAALALRPMKRAKPSWNVFALAFAVALCLICLFTDFVAERSAQAAPLRIAGVITGIIATAIWLMHCLLKHAGKWFDRAVAAAAMCVAIGFLWINYHSDLQTYRANCDDPERLAASTNNLLGDMGDAWIAVRSRCKPGDVVAYTNFAEVYPLMGFDLSHPVVYCPARPDVDSMGHFPALPKHLPGEQIDTAFSKSLLCDGDESTWLARLTAARARWLVIRADDGVIPPELHFVADNPRRFSQVPGPASYRIYQIQ